MSSDASCGRGISRRAHPVEERLWSAQHRGGKRVAADLRLDALDLHHVVDATPDELAGRGRAGAVVAEPVEQGRGIDRRERRALGVPGEVAAVVAERIPDGVGGVPDRPGAVGGVVRQGEERDAAADGLALAGDEFEPAHHRVGDPVAEAQAEEVGGGEILREGGVAIEMVGEREVDPAAREGEAGDRGVDVGVLDGVGEGAVGPAVEHNVRQGRRDHRASRCREMVVLAPRLIGHGIDTPRIFIQATDGQRGRLSLYSAFLPHFETRSHRKGGEFTVQVMVRDNNVDQALRALKKKLQREGVFREMKLRQHFEKPSVKKARERAEAIRRARKLARKKLQREGLA